MLTKFVLLENGSQRTVWLDPHQIVAVTDANEGGNFSCQIEMRSGSYYNIHGSKDEVAALINEHCRAPGGKPIVLPAGLPPETVQELRDLRSTCPPTKSAIDDL